MVRRHKSPTQMSRLRELICFPPTRESAEKMMESETDLLVTDRRRRGRRTVGKLRNDEVQLDVEDNAEVEVVDRRRQDRRRQIDPTTCERDYSGSEVDFMKAMDDYKRKSGRPFPTWSEVLEVLISMGYRKVAEPTEMEWRTSGDSL